MSLSTISYSLLYRDTWMSNIKKCERSAKEQTDQFVNPNSLARNVHVNDSPNMIYKEYLDKYTTVVVPTSFVGQKAFKDAFTWEMKSLMNVKTSEGSPLITIYSQSIYHQKSDRHVGNHMSYVPCRVSWSTPLEFMGPRTDQQMFLPPSFWLLLINCLCGADVCTYIRSIDEL